MPLNGSIAKMSSMRFRYLLPLLVSSSLFADEAEPAAYNYWHDFVNMILTLLFVLALIFLTVWFLKRIMRSRVETLNRSTGIKILERRALGPKAALYLVDILGKGVVISESPSGIAKISEFPPDADVELLLAQEQVDQPPKATLLGRLRKVMSKDGRCSAKSS